MGNEEKEAYQVIWAQHARNTFDEITAYIAIDSIFYSIKPGDEIIALIKSLPLNPYKYQECIGLPTKNKIYRKATYAGVYKIIYKIVKRQVWILDVFHGKRSPQQLKKLRRVKP